MARKKDKPEEIFTKLRQVEVLQSQDRTAADAIREIGVSEGTFYRWHQKHQGMTILCLRIVVVSLRTCYASWIQLASATGRLIPRAFLCKASFEEGG